MASTTAWYPLTRTDRNKMAWLLDDGSVMEEPPLEESRSGRRVRLAAAPKVADYKSNLDEFLSVAANKAAELNGRKLWMALGTVKQREADMSILDRKGGSQSLSSFGTKVVPYYMTGDSNTTVCWRFRHESMPIEAQIEVEIEREYSYRRLERPWKVTTRCYYPGTWPANVAVQPVFELDKQTNVWDELVVGASLYNDAMAKIRDWTVDNAIDWCDDFQFGARSFENERQAVDYFARQARAVSDLDEIDIPNLLHFNADGSGHIDKLSLRLYRTNFTQELLDQLSDFLTGTPIIEQVKEKWAELLHLFRGIGIVVPDVKDSDWWRFLVEGAHAAPVEIEFKPVTDEDNTSSSKHAVKVNLATGTIVVACSRSASKDETAVQWETSLIKAELTGQKDKFLAYAEKYAEERLTVKAEELMDNALGRATSLPTEE